MTTTHIMSDETGQLILAQLQTISQALDDGALTNQQISTVLSDGTPTGAGFLDGGGLKTFFDGLKTKFAAIVHNHSGDALTPASVTATGKVKAATIEDSGGTLAALRESVSIALSKGSKVEHGKATLVVNNGICRVSGYVNNDSTNIETGDTLFDGIPAEYRPSSSVEIPMAISTSSGVFLAYYGYVVSNNGRIIQNATATARNVFFYGEWLV